MRIAILVENYNDYYTLELRRNRALRRRAYRDQLEALYARSYYQSDSYAHALQQAGHQAEQFIFDCPPLQRRWARENGFPLPPTPEILYYRPWRWLWTQLLHREMPERRWLKSVLLEQLRRFSPDVLFVFTGLEIDRTFVQATRFVPIRVLHWASAINPTYPFDEYDLIVSSAMNFVEYFRSHGWRSEHLQHGFDERIPQRVGTRERIEGVVFVGSLLAEHQQRIRLLDELSRRIPFDFYGAGVENLPADSPMRQRFKGFAGGLRMYEIYAKYRIALHVPIDMGAAYAGAKRLFEVTGMGALLLTQAQPGLAELFDVGEEILTFEDADECEQRLRSLIADPDRTERIAKAGQRRTLTSHTMTRRMTQLSELLEGLRPRTRGTEAIQTYG